MTVINKFFSENRFDLKQLLPNIATDYAGSASADMNDGKTVSIITIFLFTENIICQTDSGQ